MKALEKSEIKSLSHFFRTWKVKAIPQVLFSLSLPLQAARLEASASPT
jgi:hypothetical protein